MPFIERRAMRTAWTWLRNGLAGFGLLAGCSTSPPEPPLAIDQAPATRPLARAETAPVKASPLRLPLRPPDPVRNWNEVRLQAARRLLAANPTTTYTDAAPDVLLAIPVLQIDLHADGSIRHIEALRLPTQARDTTQLAIDAVRRAAPFGDVSRLPKPWRFVETFLFNDERKFKPRTLD